MLRINLDAIIDNTTHSWRLDLIFEILLPIDIDRIKLIPLSTTGTPDERIWAAAEDGIFRVRDMYALALSAQNETSSSNGNDPIWKKIWSLHIHPKAKLFLWRALWDILPHGSNLTEKGIDIQGKCQTCGATETNIHALRDCSWVLQVWAKIFNVLDTPVRISFREWIAGMMDQKSQKEMEMISVSAWQIWGARNDLLFEKICHPSCVIRELLIFSWKCKVVPSESEFSHGKC